MRATPGLLAFLVGVGLLSRPWWSSTLPASDYPLVIALAIAFAAIGAFAALPDTWLRMRAGAFAMFMATFGLLCAALALSPLHPGLEGSLTIGGVSGFVATGPMPWWARVVAGSFAIVCLGASVPRCSARGGSYVTWFGDGRRRNDRGSLMSLRQCCPSQHLT
jgi:hypothetical protein